MKKYNSLKALLAGVVLTAGVLLTSPTLSSAKSFTDLNKDPSHTAAVTYLNDLKAFEYKAGLTLNGNTNVTRAEVSKILHGLYKDTLPVKRSYNNKYKDVTAKTLFSKELIWSYEVGIFDGASANTFEPTKSLTRAQMAKILVNTFALKSKGTTTFKDVNSKHWAASYINILGSTGISNGNGKGEYKPDSSVTLNQLSSFVFRVMDDKNVVKPINLAPVGKTPVTTKPVVTKPVTAPVESKYKTFDEVKKLAIALYNDPSYKPADVVVYSKTDFDEEFTDYSFWTHDISLDIPGYATFGRTVGVEVEKQNDGTYKNSIVIYNDRTQVEELAWKNSMDKAEKYIVDNYQLNTDYDVVLAINNFIGEQIEYGIDIPASNPYVVERSNATTCTGYADVAAELFKRFGITTRYLTGDVHAWNAVLMNGNWYYTDPTFNDTTKTKTGYLLMTNAERAEDIKNVESTFKVSDVKYDQSMAKAYNYASVKASQK